MRVTFSIEFPDLGSCIKTEREKQGLSPTFLAALTGMSAANLHRIENGAAKSVPHETLLKLSKVLGVGFQEKIKQELLKEVKKWKH